MQKSMVSISVFHFLITLHLAIVQCFIPGTLKLNNQQNFLITKDKSFAFFSSLDKQEQQDNISTTAASDDDASTAKVINVKCPNCDLCDGSGRYVA